MDDRQRERDENWARQVPERRYHGEYDDYGWEPGESVLPEFREPDVRLSRAEMRRLRRERWLNRENPQAPEYRMMRGESIPAGDFTGYGPQGYQRTDSRVFEDVCDRLLMHGEIDARDVVVEVKDGEVTLRGIVDTLQQKHLAEATAESVPGVINVNNDLKVRRQLGKQGTP